MLIIQLFFNFNSLNSNFPVVFNFWNAYFSINLSWISIFNQYLLAKLDCSEFLKNLIDTGFQIQYCREFWKNNKNQKMDITSAVADNAEASNNTVWYEKTFLPKML